MIPEPVRSIQLSEIQEARERIGKTSVRTPLIRLELGAERGNRGRARISLLGSIPVV